jgi:translocation and assembly module TamA
LYPSIAWSIRRFDSVIDPKRGYGLTLQVGAGAEQLLSHRSFGRVYGKWQQYFPLTDDDQLILRAELGAVFADRQDGIPNVLLFRAGGDQSIRGYAFQSVGLRRGVAVVGARYLAVGSAEYVHWFSPKWGGAAFCDVGDAFDGFAAYSAKLGFGLGARWRSPVGPVYLDAAYGEASQQFRLHFALGIRF